MRPSPILASWEQAMRAIARQANAHCKRSGLRTEPDAIVANIFDKLWEAFGPERRIRGSDWPVLTLAAGYGEWLEIARAACGASRCVFGANAQRACRLCANGRPDGGKGS